MTSSKEREDGQPGDQELEKDSCYAEGSSSVLVGFRLVFVSLSCVRFWSLVGWCGSPHLVVVLCCDGYCNLVSINENRGKTL